MGGEEKEEECENGYDALRENKCERDSVIVLEISEQNMTTMGVIL